MRVQAATAPAQVALVYLVSSGLFAVAAGGAALAAASGMTHGWWLTAYFLLVGCLSQLVLGVGQLPNPGRSRNRPARRIVVGQVGPWNLGCILVPTGVIFAVPGLVLVGGMLLLAALTAFLAAPHVRSPRVFDLLYVLYALALAASVGAGSVLAFS